MGKDPNKSSKKEKKEKATENGADAAPKKVEVCAIAKPLADDKLSKKVRAASSIGAHAWAWAAICLWGACQSWYPWGQPSPSGSSPGQIVVRGHLCAGPCQVPLPVRANLQPCQLAVRGWRTVRACERCGCALQVLKLAKKAAKRKQIKRGVKEVIKAIRKNVKGCAPGGRAGRAAAVGGRCGSRSREAPGGWRLGS